MKNKKKDAAKGGGHQAAKNGGSKAAAADAATRKTGMSIDEAMNILNITKEADLAKVVKVPIHSLIFILNTMFHPFGTNVIFDPFYTTLELRASFQSQRGKGRRIILLAVQGRSSKGALGDGVGSTRKICATRR